MLYFKVTGDLIDYEYPNSDRQEEREFKRSIRRKIEKLNAKEEGKTYSFISELDTDTVLTGISIQHTDDLEKKWYTFMNALEIPVSKLRVEEITLGDFSDLLYDADREGYLSDSDDALEMLHLDLITGRFGREFPFEEEILGICSKEEIYAEAQKYFFQEDLFSELDRIYSVSAPENIYGHPVHYLFESDDEDSLRENTSLLLQGLYENGRLKSKRLNTMVFKPGGIQFNVPAFEALYRSCAGGALIFSYYVDNESEENGYASSRHDIIELISSLAKKYRNQVLTVLWLPRECTKSKEVFFENLGTMTILELKETLADHERAKDYLRSLAEESCIEADEHLFAALNVEKGYLSSELKTIYNEWFNQKLKKSIFPQYKDLKSLITVEKQASPKGTAHGKLQEMIGLNEAKKVIRKALNYYKMQKLYEEKGVNQDHPAMHMVFTGNPGTAKTTTARLFAQIMRENGLLSKGHLVEVGRGDLVGKYVGWTASIVKKKFQEAKGGVLFIDEAYSLVDDRSGSFGDEAINTIVQEMENHRENVVVIFAGYPNPMESFLDKNPGLRSRIAFHVPFEDYSALELCEIIQLLAKNKGMTFTQDALTRLESVFDIAKAQSDFGNGRYARNLLEQSRMNQAERLLEYPYEDITAKDVVTITAEDILIPERITKERRRIGFVA